MVFLRHIAKVMFWTLAIIGGVIMACQIGLELFILVGNIIFFWGK